MIYPIGNEGIDGMELKRQKIWLLGAIFETSNMGVSVLAESCLKLIHQQWPHAEIIMPAHHVEKYQTIDIQKDKVKIKRVAHWRGKNILKPNNLYKLMAYCLLTKLFPNRGLIDRLCNLNPYFREIMEADFVFDITAGDSFSDIYGFKRFLKNALPKYLFIWAGKKLILLPQTYGPFKKRISARIAAYLIGNSAAAYSRDLADISNIRRLLGKRRRNTLLRYAPDVGFVLDPEEPPEPVSKMMDHLRKGDDILIGINVSGLLYNDNLQAVRQFGLKNDYRRTLDEIIRLLLAYPNTIICLIPHVFWIEGNRESDFAACRDLYQTLYEEFHDRIYRIDAVLNHRQVKSVIGRCDFFIGARMHSCIAAISRTIPTVGCAYSKKFIGIFTSCQIGNDVVDLRQLSLEDVLARVKSAFNNREKTLNTLQTIVPDIQNQIRYFLKEIDRLSDCSDT